jgi:hypothetical protein
VLSTAEKSKTYVPSRLAHELQERLPILAMRAAMRRGASEPGHPMQGTLFVLVHTFFGGGLLPLRGGGGLLDVLPLVVQQHG